MPRSPDSSKFLVTALVSTYNSEKFIQGCLQNLIEQTIYKKNQLEIIVINSGSNQSESKIVSKIQTHYPNITLIETKARETLYQAWNRGITISQGKYITNANTDDRHRPDNLEHLSSALEHDPIAAISYGDHYQSYGDINHLETCTHYKVNTPIFFKPSSLLCYPLGPHPMWRKSIHNEIGPFNDQYKAIGDYDFFIRATRNKKAKHVPQAISYHNIRENAISYKNSTMQDEQNQFYSKIHSIENIVASYLQLGDQPAEDFVYDFAFRACAFFPFWKQNTVFFNQPLITKCSDYLKKTKFKEESEQIMILIDTLTGKLKPKDKYHKLILPQNDYPKEWELSRIDTPNYLKIKNSNLEINLEGYIQDYLKNIPAHSGTPSKVKETQKRILNHSSFAHAAL